MSQPANAGQRADIVRQIQRDHGNSYVQRLVEHISQQKSDTVQRIDTVAGSNSFRQVLQGAAEMVLYFNDNEVHNKPKCQMELNLIGNFAKHLTDPKEKEVSSQIAGAMINYVNAKEHVEALKALASMISTVKKAVPMLPKSFASSFQSWIPGQVSWLGSTPELEQSLHRKQEQESTGPSAASSDSADEDFYNNVGPQDEEPIYNTVGPSDEPIYNNVGPQDEEPIYNNVGPQDEPIYNTDGPPDEPIYNNVSPSGKKEESPYGVPIFVDEQEEALYNNVTPKDKGKGKGFSIGGHRKK